MSSGKLLFLGTGGSLGIPVVGCSCDVCRSSSPRNKRLRPSALIQLNGKNILIDAGPDFRYQALHNNIMNLDGVILTHCHHDHTAGIDELRVFYMYTHKPLPCLLSAFSAEDLKIRYAYVFGKSDVRKLVPRIAFQELKGERGEVDFIGIKIKYMTYDQMDTPVNGFRIGDLGFITDIREFPVTIYEDLKGVKTLVLSALREEGSPMHFSFREAIDFAHKIGAQNTWFTHVAHEVDHEKMSALLPPGMAIAYDGLEIPFEYGDD